MKRSAIFLSAFLLLPVASRADSLPFGAASAYNLTALGSSTLAGTISDNTDVGGRIAAAGTVSGSLTIGSSLGTDPYSAAAMFDVVATGGLGSGTQINLNSHGNAYAPGANGNFNFNGGGHRVTSGSSGIDFASLASSLTSESTLLSGLTANGTVLGSGQSGYGNPSFYVLLGTDPTLNVFNISAAAFNDTNHPIDIVAPPGSTVVINVSGTALTLGTGIYYNGTQYAGDTTATNHVLFNFPGASSVAINGQFSASLLAPTALLTGTSQMDGTFIAAQIGQTGEVHYVAFTGTLDPRTSLTPEPTSLLLAGTGLLPLLAGIRRRRRR